MFYVAYKTLLLTFCVLIILFVYFFGWLLWNVYIFSNMGMASENACALQSWEKYFFSKQNITSNVLQT